MRTILFLRNCLFCNNIFNVTTYKPSQLFCSRTCVYISKKNGKNVFCFTCGKKIYRCRTRLRSKNYCSLSCLNKNIKIKKEVNCLFCKCKLRYHQYKYCSSQCYRDSKDEMIHKVIELGLYKSNFSATLKRYLFLKRGRYCESCGLKIWKDKPIPLELEHTDGNYLNNNLNNLKLLCPNCHAQTPTYKSKNMGKGRVMRRKVIR